MHTQRRFQRQATAVLLAAALTMSIGAEIFGATAPQAAAAPAETLAAAQAVTSETVDNGYDYTLRVNDVRLIPDATPGDGNCEIAANYGSTCTLLAAAQEANALSDADPTVKVLVTLAAPTPGGSIRQLDGSYSNEGTVLLYNTAANTPTNFAGMIRGQANMNSIVGGTDDGDGAGSVFWFSGNVVIDLQNRLDIAPPGDYGLAGTVVSFTGQDQVLRNFKGISGPEGVIYVGKTARNLLIENGRIANGPAGSGALMFATERAINVVGGSTVTQIRGVTIDSIWRAGINLVSQVGNATEPVQGLRVTDSTFSWDNRRTDNAAYGIGKWTGGVIRVNDLVVEGSMFKDFRRGSSYDRNVPISGELIELGGDARISGNSFVNTLDSAVIYGAYNNDILLTRPPAAGSTVSIDHNVFDNASSWVPSGPAVLVSGGVATSGTVAVTDNAFYGWNRNTTGQVISVTSTGGPSVSLERNTFSNVGGYTETPTNTAELPGDTANPVYLNNANGNIRTAFPSEAAVDPGACQVKVTVQRPQAGGNQPVYPVRVDAFAGGANGADNYLGGVMVASDAELGAAGKELSYPYSLGAGKLRLQTVDAQGNTSPLSRTVEVAGAAECGPQLWIRKAETQLDPSWSRLLEFEVMSSVPLADGAIEAALNLNASSTAGEVVTVRAASGDSAANTRWRVTVRANAAGTIVLGIAANAVQDRAGLSNALAANASDAPNNFVRSVDPTGVAGTPGSSLDPSATYRVPVSVSAPAGGVLTTTEGATTTESFAIEIEARDSMDRTTHAPIAAVTVQPTWSNLIADATMPDPLGDASEQAKLLPNNPSMSEDDAVMDPADRETRVSVAAIDNRVVDGTRTLTLTPSLVSDDPEFDGLVLNSLTVRVEDDDDPAAADSSVIVTSNNAVANGTSSNVVTATVLNAAGQPVQNAMVHFGLPDGLIALGGPTAVPGPTSVSGITDALGQVTQSVGSTVAHSDHSIAVTVDTIAGAVPIAGSPITVRFVPGAPSATHSVLSVSSAKLPVDGDPHEVTVRVADAFGNYIVGESVTFTAAPAATMSGGGIAVSGADGVARVAVSAQRAQPVTVTAKLGTAEVAGSPASINFGPGSYSAANSGVLALTSVAEANGRHEVALEARLKDSYDNLIDVELPNVVIASTGGRVSATEYRGDGVYTATLTASTPATVRASVSVGGSTAAGTADVRFAPTPTAPTVKPSNGTKVSGWADPHITVTVRADDGTLLATTTTNSFGWFTTPLSGSVVHDQQLDVQARDSNGFVSTVTVLVIDLIAPDAPEVERSNGWKLKICAEEGADIVIQDKHGVAIAGSLSAPNKGCVEFTPSARMTEADGVQVFAVDPAENWSVVTHPFIKTTLPPVPVTEASNGVVITGGTIEQTDTIQFLDGKGNRLRGMIAVDEKGRFTFTPTPRLVTGDEVAVRVADLVGNSIEAPIPIDNTSPPPPVVSKFTSEVVAGYAEPGSTVTVTDADGALLGTAVAGLDGYFEIELSLAPTRNEVITLVVTDELGNKSKELQLRLSAASILIERPVLGKDDAQTVHGFGYIPGERVTATFDNSAVAPVSAVVGASGNVTIEVQLNASVELGEHTILLAGDQTTLRSEKFTVAEQSVWSLAQTGSNGGHFVALGLAVVLLLGAVAMLRGRRRAHLN